MMATMVVDDAESVPPAQRRLDRPTACRHRFGCRKAAGGTCSIRDHLWYMGAMAETPETQLIEALKKVDVYGDIAPPHVQDPMTMVLRQNAIQADLIRWDDSRARFVLTGTGRNRITARSRTSGKILRFKMRDEKDGRGPLRKA